jgi:hypothetical protein
MAAQSEKSHYQEKGGRAILARGGGTFLRLFTVLVSTFTLTGCTGIVADVPGEPWRVRLVPKSKGDAEGDQVLRAIPELQLRMTSALSLNGTQVGDEELRVIVARVRTIRFLDLQYTDVTAAGVKDALRSNTSIRTVWVSDIDGIEVVQAELPGIISVWPTTRPTWKVEGQRKGAH